MTGHQIGLIAHKGYSSQHPPNTLPAFQAALAYDPIGIEMDIVVFRDQLVLYHPLQHQRIYGEDVDLVIQKELGQQAQENKPFNSLDQQVVQLLDHTKFLLLDLKQKDIKVLPRFIELLSSYNLKQDQIVVGARDPEKLRELRSHHHLYQILSLSPDPDAYSEYIKQGASTIRLWEDDVTQAIIDAIHGLQAKVWVTPGKPTTPERKGTAGEIVPEKLLLFQHMGVDAVLVNDIKMARETLEKV